MCAIGETHLSAKHIVDVAERDNVSGEGSISQAGS